MKRGKESRKGALELSIGTVVIVVIAMTMLVLGLALVRNIFSGATDSVIEINERVKDQIKTLFETSAEDVVVRLGSANTGNVRQGTNNFGFVFAIAPTDTTKLGECKYTIALAPSTGDAEECFKLNYAPLSWITSGTNDRLFDKTDAHLAYALVQLTIPATVSPCNQRFHIQIKDGSCGTGFKPRSYFQINIIKRGFFG